MILVKFCIVSHGVKLRPCARQGFIILPNDVWHVSGVWCNITVKISRIPDMEVILLPVLSVWRLSQGQAVINLCFLFMG